MRGVRGGPGRKSLLLVFAAAAATLGIAAVAFAATIQCTGGPCSGTFAADTITGSEFDDQISAGGGSDNVDANQGGDFPLFKGDDTINGGLGNDSIDLSATEDSGIAAGSEDFVNGNAGADTIVGGEDTDDEISNGPGDAFSGGLGNDSLTSVDVGDAASLFGNSGGDTLNAQDAPAGPPDILNGGAGVDVCIGDPPHPTFGGGDTFIGCETIITS
jgi:Ca2+-binding RTX toxin-like protein